MLDRMRTVYSAYETETARGDARFGPLAAGPVSEPHGTAAHAPDLRPAAPETEGTDRDVAPVASHNPRKVTHGGAACSGAGPKALHLQAVDGAVCGTGRDSGTAHNVLWETASPCVTSCAAEPKCACDSPALDHGPEVPHRLHPRGGVVCSTGPGTGAADVLEDIADPVDPCVTYDQPVAVAVGHGRAAQDQNEPNGIQASACHMPGNAQAFGYNDVLVRLGYLVCRVPQHAGLVCDVLHRCSGHLVKAWPRGETLVVTSVGVCNRW